MRTIILTVLTAITLTACLSAEQSSEHADPVRGALCDFRSNDLAVRDSSGAPLQIVACGPVDSREAMSCDRLSVFWGTSVLEIDGPFLAGDRVVGYGAAPTSAYCDDGVIATPWVLRAIPAQ